jgi:hypothetical protein
MGLLRSLCARFGGAGILCLVFGLAAPTYAHAEAASSGGGLLNALGDIIGLLPKFNHDPADLKHLEKALVQLLDVLERNHHHHHKHKHHKGSFGKGMNLSQGINTGSQTSPVSVSNPGNSAGTAAQGKTAKTKANPTQNKQKQNAAPAVATKSATSQPKTATAKTASPAHSAKANLKGLHLAMNLAQPQMHAHAHKK